jgi:CheY-like chemotaxis protein
MDLAEVVRSSVGVVTSSQKIERLVRVTAESVWVDADPVRLEQIVGNLVSNALKFAGPDQPVRVAVGARDADAVLEVSDDGAGIEPDLLPSIFDLFVQAPAAVDRAKGGLGIGLTLVRRLVELHGGTVNATSGGKDQGSTFIVRLPATRRPAVAVAGVPAAAEGQGKRVLLVDDNADSREMYSFILQADGHDVHAAADGAAALERFHHQPLDVAVIDIGLPGMDGYELARRIRATPSGRRITLIALTGYGFPEDRERSRAAGFDQHLVKPASPEDLKRELSRVDRQPPQTVRPTRPD